MTTTPEQEIKVETYADETLVLDMGGLRLKIDPDGHAFLYGTHGDPHDHALHIADLVADIAGLMEAAHAAFYGEAS